MADQSNAGSLAISQEYYDEVCLENRDDFDLSEEEAVQETIQQLESDGKKLPSHLILSFPTSPEGIRERKVNQELKGGIMRLQSFAENNKQAPETSTDNDEEGLSATLQTLLESLRRDESQRVPRFVVNGGFEACIQLWRSTCTATLMEGWVDEKLFELLLLAFQVEKSMRAKGDETVIQLEDLQMHFYRLWPAWLTLLESSVSPQKMEMWNLGRLNQILRLGNFAVKHSEPNKKVFMAAKSNATAKSTPSILLGALDNLSLTDKDCLDHHRLVGGPLCRLVAAVCTFDDFRLTEGAPTVSSAHVNVQSFHQENGVLRLARYLQEKKETSAILALRAMAIHDEIVQAMVAVRVLDTSTSLLQRLLSVDTNADDPETTLEALTAVAGLFRNVCANDEIKSKLCIGDKSIVQHLICAMEAYPDAAKLQEHACATFGAMALRSPKNAEFLIKQNDVVTWIVRAMRKHPNRTTVQRQGALALRNLVSRSTDLRANVLQAGAAEALKEIAAKHVSCQDEVYAALRDLGLPANMLRVEQDASGQVVVKQTEMFGGRNNNFRPVFD
eukprot:scaffold132_cov170-Amphora_coffeaeformis.AAC.50